MEAQLRSDAVTIPGFFLNPTDPAFVHFSTHNIDPEALEDNRIVFALSGALAIIKNTGNFTKSQLKHCLKSLHLNNFCKPKKINCNPNEVT